MIIRINKNIPNRILLILLCFLYIFYPPFTRINTLFYLGIIAYIYIAFNFNSFTSFMRDGRIGNYYFILVVANIYLCLVALAHGSTSDIFIEPFRDFLYLGILAVPISFFICDEFFKSGGEAEDFIKILFIVANIQGLFALVSFFNSRFHNWVLQNYINYGYDAERYTTLARYRLYGLAFHLTNYSPMVVALLIIIAFYYARKRTSYLLYVPLMFAFVLLNSRTAIVMVILGFLLLVITSMSNGQNMIKAAVVTMLVAIAAIISMNFIINRQDTWYGGWVKYGYDTIKSFFTGENLGYAGYIMSNSVWKIPNGFHLLTGYGNSSLYYGSLMQSDVGYIHYLWRGGLVFAFFVVLINRILIGELVKNQDTRVLSYAIILIIAIGNVKDTIYSVDEFMMILILLFVFSIKQEYHASLIEGDN